MKLAFRAAVSLTVLLGSMLTWTDAMGAPRFNGAQAYAYLEKQCSFGPRNPGSAGHDNCRRWLKEQLQQFGFDVYEQSFEAVESVTGQTRTLTNIIGHKGGDGAPLVLCAHWDTRATADEERDFAQRSKPILGANDGASGVAVLLEIARLTSLQSPPRDLLIVLFDGEDMGRASRPSEFAVGSAYWAKNPVPLKPDEGILLDMVGDAELSLPVEMFSERYAPHLRRHIWQLAEEIGETAFVETYGEFVVDDHLPLNAAGIPTIDIIDRDYPYWHTLQDTPDKCSAESLNSVGRVLVRFIWGE